MAKKKEQENYLDYIPVRSPELEWDVNKDIVTLHVVNKGFYNKIAQKIFRTPRVSHIHMEKYGSYLWQEMDGVKTVEELAKLLKTRFGEEAEPLYPRLVKYMAILKDNKFIQYVGKDK